MKRTAVTVATAVVGGLIALIMPAATASVAEPVAVDTALVFVVDVSGSMDREERGVARESHAAALTSPDVLAAIAEGKVGRIAVAYVEFGGYGRPRLPWTVIDGPEAADAFAEAIRELPPTVIAFTNIAAGLHTARDVLAALPHPASRLVVDVVGDGYSHRPGADATSVRDARTALVDSGVTVNGMPLMIHPDGAMLGRYYADHVIGGPGAFSMPLRDIDQMPAALRQKILLELY